MIYFLGIMSIRIITLPLLYFQTRHPEFISGSLADTETSSI